MKTVIYLDVLLAVNFVIGWLLLSISGRLTAMSGGAKRLTFGAFAAAFSSLLLLAPPLHPVPGALLKLLAGAVAVLFAFRWVGLRAFLRAAGCYGMLNFLLAGMVSFAAQRPGARGVFSRNMAVYLDISPFLLVGCVLAVWLLLEAWACLFAAPGGKTVLAAVLYLQNEKTPIGLQLFYDTGLSVTDPYTGLPVVVCSWPDMADKLPAPLRDALAAYFKSGTLAPGLRLLPCQTAAENTLLPICPALLQPAKGAKKPLPVTAAFTPAPLCGGRYAALAGPQLAAVFA